MSQVCLQALQALLLRGQGWGDCACPLLRRALEAEASLASDWQAMLIDMWNGSQSPVEGIAALDASLQILQTVREEYVKAAVDELITCTLQLLEEKVCVHLRAASTLSKHIMLIITRVHPNCGV